MAISIKCNSGRQIEATIKEKRMYCTLRKTSGERKWNSEDLGVPYKQYLGITGHLSKMSSLKGYNSGCMFDKILISF